MRQINRKAFAKLAMHLWSIEDAKFTMQTLHRCGSVGCIAGHALWLLDPSPDGKSATDAEWLVSDAEWLLGLTSYEGDQLFSPDGFRNTRHPADRLLAAALCDHIAKGGAVPNGDWLMRARNAWDEAA